MNCSQAESLVSSAPQVGVCGFAAAGLAASVAMALQRARWPVVPAALVATVSFVSLFASPTVWTVAAGMAIGALAVCRLTAAVTGASGCASFAVAVFGEGYPLAARVMVAAVAALFGGTLGVTHPEIALAWGTALTSGVLATFCAETVAVALTGTGYCFMFGAEVAAACAGAGMYAQYRRIEEDDYHLLVE